MSGPQGLTLVFGGSFDPPHRGHMALLRCACAAARPRSVVVVPAGTPPHKRPASAPAAARLAMCACFGEVFAGARTSDAELVRSAPHYTIDTLELLRRQGSRDLALCVGGDALRGFHTWRRCGDIARLAALVVAGRAEAGPDAEAADFVRGLGGTVLFAPGEVPPVSSTEVRAAAAGGRELSPLVPPLVRDIILREGLYREEPFSCQLVGN